MCNSELKSSFRLSLSFTKCPSPPSCSLSPFVSGVELSFKTRAPDGLLLCSFSPGNQEEFLAVQIKNGRPYFLFDPQVGNVFQKRLCIIETFYITPYYNLYLLIVHFCLTPDFSPHLILLLIPTHFSHLCFSFLLYCSLSKSLPFSLSLSLI